MIDFLIQTYRDVGWKRPLCSAVAGAVTLILLSETLRWWLGKGFFQ